MIWRPVPHSPPLLLPNSNSTASKFDSLSYLNYIQPLSIMMSNTFFPISAWYIAYSSRLGNRVSIDSPVHHHHRWITQPPDTRCRRVDAGESHLIRFDRDRVHGQSFAANKLCEAQIEPTARLLIVRYSALFCCNNSRLERWCRRWSVTLSFPAPRLPTRDRVIGVARP